ncbi:MAG: glutamate 5-kinase [Candidatus Methanomethylophilaceae archaeon]|nr:glutamate 5-kinase [Candidatus Methanomethylophilaceae archaeon]
MSERKDLLGDVRRVVVKIGTTSLIKDGAVSKEFMDSVAEQVFRLREEGRQVLIVTSGAIGIGLKAMGAKPKPNEMPIRQAAASVGQSILMQRWSESFQRYGILVAQILMTFDVYSDRDSANNLNNTVESLLDNSVVPIFNENDAVCINEIKFGDNDTLSAIVASRTDSDLLVILSDIDGLYDSNPSENRDARFIPVVHRIDDSIKAMAGGTSSGFGTGGMKTKIDAAEICRDARCNMIIASSKVYGVVYRTVAGDDVGTLFVSGDEVPKKRRWIKSAHAAGRITIDKGAEKAVLEHRSLLPVGIRKVEGEFRKGEVVEIVCEGRIIAKGVPSYSSKELASIAGRHSDEIEGILGYRLHADAVLSENIALLTI